MVGDVKVRFVRSDGQSFTVGDGTWRIPNDGLENWANLPYQVSSVEIPSYDGALVTSKRVNSIDRSVTAVLAKPSDNEEMRALAVSFFNPKHSYDAYITYMGRTRWCHGELAGFKASNGNIYEAVQLDITLLCPNPYLQSVDNFGKDIAEIKPMFAFPYGYIKPQGEPDGITTGFVTGIRSFSKQVNIRSDGDVPSGLKATITCEGAVKNPMLKAGEGFVRFLTTLKKGDVAVIDTTTRPPKVELNGSNAMQLLDIESSILDMVIGVGVTTVEYDAESGERDMHVLIEYNKQYLGI